MKAFELTGATPDGKKASVWACGKCLRFTPLDPSKDAAERCCQPTLCACGAEVALGSQCDACRKMERDARYKALFDKARKVPASQHDGWLYDERTDRYFEDVESLLEHHDHARWDEPVDLEDLPTWAWGCTAEKFSAPDAQEVMESALDDWFEDACDHLPDLASLQAELDKVAACIPDSNYADYSVVVTFEEEAREYVAKRSKEGAELAKAEVSRG